jgi:hypothetical protein
MMNDILSRMSTRSPGKTRPATLDGSLTSIEIARIPGVSTAARKPRSPGRAICDSVIGSPATMPLRTTAPTMVLTSACPQEVAVVDAVNRPLRQDTSSS